MRMEDVEVGIGAGRAFQMKDKRDAYASEHDCYAKNHFLDFFQFNCKNENL